MPADTVLTPRPKDIPAWEMLNADQKKVYARMMGRDRDTGARLDALVRGIDWAPVGTNGPMEYRVTLGLICTWRQERLRQTPRG